MGKYRTPNVMRSAYSARIRSIVGYIARHASHSQSRNSTRTSSLSGVEDRSGVWSRRTDASEVLGLFVSLPLRLQSNRAQRTTAKRAIRPIENFVMVVTFIQPPTRPMFVAECH